MRLVEQATPGPVAGGRGPLTGRHRTGRDRRLALIVDPRFSGGTSSAVAAEIRALGGRLDLSVFAVETAMFKGRGVNPGLRDALDEQGLELIWDAPVIRADTAVFHNPSCLKFNRAIQSRISCRRAFVVTHENFQRPNGSEGFDVAGCLNVIGAALVCGERLLAPVSAYNRRGVEAWLAQPGNGEGWGVAASDWINVLDLDLVTPTTTPRDRRGRHSRPGFEKFPPRDTMLAHFPPHAEHCAILGGDGFLLGDDPPPRHWKVLRFGEVEVADFLRDLDFFVYFTHPQWRESFGRAIADAIAAGKVVITDPGTAEAFGTAVVASDGHDVDQIIRAFVADPSRYVEFARAAQASLARFGSEVFAGRVLSEVARSDRLAHVLL